MNKDKRIVVQVLADLCGAYSTQQRAMPNKVLMILRDAVKGLAESEQRSLKRMEPFKDNVGTAVNYQNGLDCWEDLVAAQEALEEGELEEAFPLLSRVAVPVEPVAPVAAPTKTRKRRVRK